MTLTPTTSAEHLIAEVLGGVVLERNPAMSMSTYDPDEVEYDDDGFAKPMPTERCDNHPSPTCSGTTLPRTSRSGLTHSLKCTGCQGALDDRLAEIDQRYPDSDNPPSWFDPTYAGESWDGE